MSEVKVFKALGGKFYVFAGRSKLFSIDRQSGPQTAVAGEQWIAAWFDGGKLKVMSFDPSRTWGQVAVYDTSHEPDDQGRLKGSFPNLIATFLPSGEWIPPLQFSAPPSANLPDMVKTTFADGRLTVVYGGKQIFEAADVNSIEPQRICEDPVYWRFWRQGDEFFVLFVSLNYMGEGHRVVIHRYDLTQEGVLKAQLISLAEAFAGQAFAAPIEFPEAKEFYRAATPSA